MTLENIKESILYFISWFIKWFIYMPIFISIGSIRSVIEFFKFEFKKFYDLELGLDDISPIKRFKHRTKRIFKLAIKSDNSEVISYFRNGYNYDYVDTLKESMFEMIKQLVPYLKKNRYIDVQTYMNEQQHAPTKHDLNSINNMKELISIYDYILHGRNELKETLSQNWEWVAAEVVKLGKLKDNFEDQKDLEEDIKSYIDFNKELMKQTKKEFIIEDVVEAYLDYKDQEMLIKIINQRHNLWD